MIDILETVERLGTATMAGGLIGIDRNLHGKPTGVRTLALVGVGSAILTMGASNFAFNQPNPDAISRVIQGIVTGVGFIGGGAILRDPEKGDVSGLTTAAAVWITAALGVVCGLGDWRVAAVSTAFVILILLTGKKVERLGQVLFNRSHDPDVTRASADED